MALKTLRGVQKQQAKPEAKASATSETNEMTPSKMWKNLPLKLKILTAIIVVLVNLAVVLLIYWVVTGPPESIRYGLPEELKRILAALAILFGSGFSYTSVLWDSLVAEIGDSTIVLILSILGIVILFSIYFMLARLRPRIRFGKTTPAGAFEADEFRRTFPTCPICSSSLGYEATLKFLTPYVRCRNCGAVWEKIARGSIRKIERRYILVEPDKEMRANSLVRKGDVDWDSSPYGWKTNWGYEVEFWKVLDYVNRHGGEISIPQASGELGLSEATLKKTIDKLKKVYKATENEPE